MLDFARTLRNGGRRRKHAIDGCLRNRFISARLHQPSQGGVSLLSGQAGHLIMV